ncbi:hypothetical protein BDW68DRAFT_151303 [Aspergillus falconensis]
MDSCRDMFQPLNRSLTRFVHFDCCGSSCSCHEPHRSVMSESELGAVLVINCHQYSIPLLLHSSTKVVRTYSKSLG